MDGGRLSGKEQHGKHGSEDRDGTAEYRYAGDGIVLQQNAPYGICDGGEEGEVDQIKHAAKACEADASARDKSHQCHKESARHKLVTADGDGILVSGITLDQNRGEGVCHGGKDHKHNAQKLRGASRGGQAVKIDDHDSQKSHSAGKDLFYGQLFLLEDQSGDQYREKRIGSAGNGALDTAGVGEAEVEEHVLDHGLHRGDLQYLVYVFTLGEKQLATGDAEDHHGQNARKEESDARKKHDGGNTLNLKKAISCLNGRGCASPKGTAEQSQ